MNRILKFEYGFESVNGIIKKVYYLHEIPIIQQKCDVWNVLPIKYVRQFTGLKDKNGTEIYEGDILNMSEDSKNPLRKIEHYTGCFWFAAIGKDWKFPINMIIEEHLEAMVVIGNVYENPELLVSEDKV